jgi:hypothetical protein
LLVRIFNFSLPPFTFCWIYNSFSFWLDDHDYERERGRGVRVGRFLTQCGQQLQQTLLIWEDYFGQQQSPHGLKQFGLVLSVTFVCFFDQCYDHYTLLSSIALVDYS